MKLKVTKSKHPTFKAGVVVGAIKPNLSDEALIIRGMDGCTYFARKHGKKFTIGGKFGDPVVELVRANPELSPEEKKKRRDMWIEIGILSICSIVLLIAGVMK
jgi:hypothetical protein